MNLHAVLTHIQLVFPSKELPETVTLIIIAKFSFKLKVSTFIPCYVVYGCSVRIIIYVYVCTEIHAHTHMHTHMHRVTGDDGQCSSLLSQPQLGPGLYRLHFDSHSYLTSQGHAHPYHPYIEVGIAPLI